MSIKIKFDKIFKKKKVLIILCCAILVIVLFAAMRSGNKNYSVVKLLPFIGQKQQEVVNNIKSSNTKIDSIEDDNQDYSINTNDGTIMIFFKNGYFKGLKKTFKDPQKAYNELKSTYKEFISKYGDSEVHGDLSDLLSDVNKVKTIDHTYQDSRKLPKNNELEKALLIKGKEDNLWIEIAFRKNNNEYILSISYI